MVAKASAAFSKVSDDVVDALDTTATRVSGFDSFNTSFQNTLGLQQPALQLTPSPVTSLMSSIASAQPDPAANDPKAKVEDPMVTFQDALKASKVAPPIDKLNTRDVATNTKQNHDAGVSKGVKAEAGIEALRTLAQDTAKKMDGGQTPQLQQKSPDGQGMGLLGRAAADGVISAGLNAVLPGAGIVYGAMTAARAMSPSINPEGMGTFSQASREAPSQFKTTSLSERRSGKGESGYVRQAEPAPQFTQGSAPQSNAFMSKLQNIPGELSARSTLAGDNLTGITAIKLDKMVTDSPAMAQLKTEQKDAGLVHDIHEKRLKNGILTDDKNMDRALALGVPENAMQAPIMRGLHI